MGLFDFFKEEQNQIDYDSIGTVINGVLEKLNEYMIDVPEVILDQEKEKNLLKDDGTIDKKYAIDLASYYCAILIWYSSNKKASDGLVKYVDEHYPAFERKMAEEMFEKSQDKSKKTEHALFHLTESLLNLQIATNIKRMEGSSKTISTTKMPEVLGDTILNEYFNQKCSSYNRALLKESLSAVLDIANKR